ncbi:MAG: hypothetical protein ACP5HU_01540 [Phycisphaerae bacterium]
MISVFSAVALGILALLSAWLPCYDKSKKGFRRIRPIGWFFVVLIVALTFWSALLAQSVATKAEEQRVRLTSELGKAHDTVQRLQDVNTKASIAIAQIGRFQKERAAIDTWETTVRLNVAAMRAAAVHIGQILAIKNVEMRAAQVKGWCGEGDVLSQAIDTLGHNWETIEQIFYDGTSGSHIVSAHGRLLQERLSWLRNCPDGLGEEAKLEYFHSTLLNCCAVAEEALQMTRLEFELVSSSRAAGIDDQKIESIIMLIRERTSKLAEPPTHPSE